ncbi:MAG: hypothetical protein NUV65_02405 [Candidatus Roizmanbacteria bacterium]|nr:hypothetical protein [Candidatus Roizmanbacteria bacterium]
MNTQLRKLYEDDIADRNSKIADEILNENDRQRIVQVENILSHEHDLSALDYHHAALIFQHGEKLAHYKQAHILAIKAVELGDDSARWLAAASLDRSLLMEGKAQKYGTQFKLNDQNEWELAQPIDPNVTDKERAKWNVPPLKNALKVYRQKYTIRVCLK